MSASTQQQVLEDRYVDAKKAAKILAVSVHFLNRLRLTGGGPTYSKFGRACRYSVANLHRWAAENAGASTTAHMRPPSRS